MANNDLYTRRIFVAMPFTKTPNRDKADLDEFFDQGIRHCIETARTLKYRYTVERSGEEFDISAELIRALFRADVVLADLSGNEPNANVMYELGIRLALTNRPVILLREEHEDNRPIFDIGHFHIFPYKCNEYSSLQRHLLQNLERLERMEGTTVSPILKALEIEPSVVELVSGERLVRILTSLHVQLAFYMYDLAASIQEWARNSDVSLPPPPDPSGLDNREILFNSCHWLGEMFGPKWDDYSLHQLDWSNFRFPSHRIPSLEMIVSEGLFFAISVADQQDINLVNGLFFQLWAWISHGRFMKDEPRRTGLNMSVVGNLINGLILAFVRFPRYEPHDHEQRREIAKAMAFTAEAFSQLIGQDVKIVHEGTNA